LYPVQAINVLLLLNFNGCSLTVKKTGSKM
jgi:hypothetical protein